MMLIRKHKRLFLTGAILCIAASGADKKLITWGADTPVSSWLRDYHDFT